MKSSKEYDLSKPKNILIQGPPGTGKTCTAVRFDKVGLIDADQNLAAGITFLKQRDPKKELKWDTPHEDAKGEPLPSAKKWLRFVEINIEMLEDESVQTIVWDSMSRIKDMLIDYILAADSGYSAKNVIANERTMQIHHWGTFYSIMIKALMRLCSNRKTFIVIAHDALIKDEVSGSMEVFPNIPGQLKDQLAGLFQEYWHAEVKNKGMGELQYIMRTVPAGRYKAKTTMGLPHEFEFKPDEFYEILTNLQKA